MCIRDRYRPTFKIYACIYNYINNYINNYNFIPKRGRPHDCNFEAAFQELCTFIDTSGRNVNFLLKDLMLEIDKCLPKVS